MNNHNTDPGKLKDEKAQRREEKRRKKKAKMRQHGRALKKPTDRTAEHIAKVEKEKKKNEDEG